MTLDDTIVAMSSPPGRAARGIVRLSGADARAVAGRVFQGPDGKSLGSLTGATSLAGTLRMGGATLPAHAWVFVAPRSYTGQDMVELHLLGAPGVLGMVVEALIAAGGRRAEPGEFTARAFLAGRMDLSQAHGVAAMIAARSDDQLRAADRLLHGELSRTAHAAREELADLLSLVEGAMDFADEPIEFITPVELRRRLQSVHAALDAAVRAGLRAERWGQLPRVVLLGRPNAGKSSLLNRLTGADRAICTPIAGTTRDLIAAPLALEDGECLLMDAAGVETADDDLDAAAQRATERAVRDADLILFVVDITRDDGRLGAMSLPTGSSPLAVVLNKADEASIESVEAWTEAAREAHPGVPIVLTSALTGEGCDNLVRQIGESLRGRTADAGEAVIALMAEQHEALEGAVRAIDNALALAAGSADSLADADLIAVEMHAAAEQLAVLVGEDAPDELLGRVFARFCIGK